MNDNMKRSEFIKNTSIFGAGMLLHKFSFAAVTDEFPVVRTPLNERKFNSPAIEAVIAEFKKKYKQQRNRLVI